MAAQMIKNNELKLERESKQEHQQVEQKIQFEDNFDIKEVGELTTNDIEISTIKVKKQIEDSQILSNSEINEGAIGQCIKFFTKCLLGSK